MSDIQLHSAGATVRHKSSFDHLSSYENEEDLTQEFIDIWTVPYYMELNRTDLMWVNQLIKLKSTISDEVVLTNLGEFNWRTRQTGAFFAAILDKKEYTDIIGVHFLKSEVCFAGVQYAKVLASFNTDKSIEYLFDYLNYYLEHPELYFDQTSAFDAVNYLDKVNGTNLSESIFDKWEAFIHWRNEEDVRKMNYFKTTYPDLYKDEDSEEMKVRWNVEVDLDSFARSVQVIQSIREN